MGLAGGCSGRAMPRVRWPAGGAPGSVVRQGGTPHAAAAALSARTCHRGLMLELWPKMEASWANSTSFSSWTVTPSVCSRRQGRAGQARQRRMAAHTGSSWGAQAGALTSSTASWRRPLVWQALGLAALKRAWCPACQALTRATSRALDQRVSARGIISPRSYLPVAGSNSNVPGLQQVERHGMQGMSAVPGGMPLNGTSCPGQEGQGK